MKKTTRDIIVVGGTICALFFGSGNIVLPLMIGQLSAADSWTAYFGFITGAVFLPLIGLIAISMRDGSYERFFKSFILYILMMLPIKKTKRLKQSFLALGRHFSFVITLVVLLIMGPLGVIPRCLTVAEGGAHAMVNMPNYIMQGLFSLLVWCVVCKKDQVMPLIARVLTPIKLSLLVGVVGLCLIFSPDTPALTSHVEAPFSWGMVMGYQTLDLLGAIFCGTIVIEYIRSSEHLKSKGAVLSFSIKASLVGALILSALYLGFTMLAVRFSSSIANLNPEDILITIATFVLGKYAAAVVGLTIMVSCLTTAVALMTVWTTFITNYLEGKCKVNYQVVLTLSLIVSYLVSLLGLKRILDLLAPILQFAYPMILLITVVNLIIDVVKIFRNKSEEDSEKAKA